MIKPVLQVAALGVVGVAMWKLASLVLFPVLFFVLKFVLVASGVALVWWLINKRKDAPPTSESSP